MKKISLFFCCFTFCASIFAGDFSIQWIYDMSSYMQKSDRDIPGGFYQSKENKNLYIRENSDETEEYFLVDNKKRIEGIYWTRLSEDPAFLTSEFDRLTAIITNELGQPYYEGINDASWKWQSWLITIKLFLSSGCRIDLSVPFWQ